MRCDLRQVVEDGATVIGVELGVAVGDLDHETARVSDQQRDRSMAPDDVRVDRKSQDGQARVEIVVPHLVVPTGQEVAAPDGVDEDVETAALGFDARDQLSHLRRLEVVADDRDDIPSAPCGASGHLLNRLRPIDLGSAVFAATSGGVDDRPGGGQLDRESTTRTASRTGDEGSSSGEGLMTIHVQRSFLMNNRMIVYIPYHMPTGPS